MKLIHKLIPVSILFAGFLAGSATAAPLIIDEACVQNGCFPGDNPGLPVEIEEPGSYRLGSNLEMSPRDSYGILIISSNVHLDMDGFAILGENRCEWTGETAECQKKNESKVAILSLQTAESVTVENGSIRGIAGGGLYLNASAARVENMTIQEVAGDGISLGEGGGIIADCVVDRAGRIAIYAPTIKQPVIISRSVIFRSTQAFNAGELDNVAARHNGQGITNLNAVIDGSVDEFSTVIP